MVVIVLTDLSFNQFGVHRCMIASVFSRGAYTEIHTHDNNTLFVMDTVGDILKQLFNERGST